MGLRPHHYPDLAARGAFAARRESLWLEVLSDNFLWQRGGPGLYHLARLAEAGKMLMHGVGLDVAGIQPIDEEYLGELTRLASVVKPTSVSDHLCFTSAGGHSTFDLLPIPYTMENLRRVASRVARIQEILDRRLLLENVSSYVRCALDEMSEFNFLAELAARTGAGILLDVNNAFVSAFNHGGNARAEIDKLASHHVGQYHLAGHSDEVEYKLDTHDQRVVPEVLALLHHARSRFGDHPIILERDDDLPLHESLEELDALLD